MSNKDDSTFLEEHLWRFIAGDVHETQNLYQMKILTFFMHIFSVSILGQILIYSTFLHFSITLFKRDHYKAKVFRSAIHFFGKCVHWHYNKLSLSLKM